MLYMDHQLVRAVRLFIEWLRTDRDIVVGTEFRGPDAETIGAGTELIMLLAHAQDGMWPWTELEKHDARVLAFATAADWAQKSHRLHRINIPAWEALPEWQTCPDMVELLRYMWAFRYYHRVDLSNPRQFRYDDLGDLGELLLGRLVNTAEFEGDWVRFANRRLLADAARFAQGVCWPRLEAYAARNNLGPLPHQYVYIASASV